MCYGSKGLEKSAHANDVQFYSAFIPQVLQNFCYIHKFKQDQKKPYTSKKPFEGSRCWFQNEQRSEEKKKDRTR